MKSVRLVETTQLAEAVTGTPSRHFRARLIEGDIWGSSGYYSKKVLEAAATDKVFASQTPIFLDHPTLTERMDRPERSVRDLAGKLVSDAVFESDGLYADIEVYPHAAPLIEAMVETIGMSIRATAEVEQGEAAGRRGTIIARFDTAESVDFVTAAGAGGKVVSLLESARVNAQALKHGVAEATVNDKREALNTIVRDAYAADKTYVWLRDFDDTTAWFDVEAPDDSATWAQDYTSGSDDIPNALIGDRIEVRVSTTYVPAVPAGPVNTEESSGGHMGTTQIEESALAELREKAGRAETAETELATEKARADKADAELAEAKAAGQRAIDADSVIAAVATEHGITFNGLEVAGLKAALPVKENALDTEAFTTTVKTHAAKLAESQGAGSMFGFGGSAPTAKGLTEAELNAELGITVKGA